MRVLIRQLFALAAALAVFVVGATCTRAGCLIPASVLHSHGAAPAAASTHTSCCAEREATSNPHGSKPTPTKPCPACENPLFSAGSLTKSVAQLGALVVLVPFLAALACFATLLAPAVLTLRPRWERPPDLAPPTLLGLHCALVI